VKAATGGRLSSCPWLVRHSPAEGEATRPRNVGSLRVKPRSSVLAEDTSNRDRLPGW
jgi:hypothetical protein